VSCGPSDLAVIDADHGVRDDTQLLAWMKSQNLPDTFVVRTGRDNPGETGYHLYYRGAIDSTVFNRGGVRGEIKSLGGYVVGAGSIHPSGKKYVVVQDAAIAPLPDAWKSLPKDKSPSTKAKPLIVSSLVQDGHRNIALTSFAGYLQNFRDGSLPDSVRYDALKSYAHHGFDDGENYAVTNDDKITTAKSQTS
jgi:hypothetical protein